MRQYELKSITKFTSLFKFVFTMQDLQIGQKVTYKGKFFEITKILA